MVEVQKHRRPFVLDIEPVGQVEQQLGVGGPEEGVEVRLVLPASRRIGKPDHPVEVVKQRNNFV